MSVWDLTNIEGNLLSILLVLILAGSVVQGAFRGASGSARHLFVLVMEGLFTLLSLFLAWQVMQAASPRLGNWLVSLNIVIPEKQLGPLEQLYFTLITALRDFSLMRSGAIFLAGYWIIKGILGAVAFPIVARWYGKLHRGDEESRSWLSAPFGALIGSVIGTGRALMLIAVLFVYTSLYPNAAFTGYVQQSSIYQKGATEVIEPFTGDFLKSQLPVLTRALESQYQSILQRKYEIIDSRIPDDIAGAAKEITAKKDSDEDKAKALYQWIGTRIQYDWNKVRLYEEQRVWKEQTPEETFRTKQGVCIDYSRLYAVMARSVGLDAKVVTGIGFVGRGQSGPHAWNEVYLSDQKKWVPLDSTWVAGGGNWFNPPNFYETHIKDA